MSLDNQNILHNFSIFSIQKGTKIKSSYENQLMTKKKLRRRTVIWIIKDLSAFKWKKSTEDDDFFSSLPRDIKVKFVCITSPASHMLKKIISLFWLSSSFAIRCLFKMGEIFVNIYSEINYSFKKCAKNNRKRPSQCVLINYLGFIANSIFAKHLIKWGWIFSSGLRFKIQLSRGKGVRNFITRMSIVHWYVNIF